MINKLKLYFYKIKIVFITSAIVFFLGLFFGFNKTIKAEQTDYELSFYIDEFNSYSLFYSEGETIEEIPTLDSNLLFVGWYDNEFYNGVNYYGEAVDELTPNILYALIYYKDPVLDDLEVVPYLDGYEIVLYKGSVVDTYLNIPSYYIEETETEGLYEAKDILSISESTFANNNNPAYITIPKTVTNIDWGAFSYLDNLEGIYVYDENEHYSSDTYGVLLNKEQTEIIHFPAKLYYDTYKVPESVEVIKSNTFSNTKDLKKVIIGSNVKTIFTEAFNNNFNLEFVLVNDGLLETIESEAFLNNDKLVKVMIPSTVLYVGSDAFKGSNEELDIYYQDKVNNIPISWDADWNVSSFNIIEEYDLITYTVTYLNDDDSIIDTEVVSFNKDAVKEVSRTKENNAQYSYIFSHFEGESLENIVSDITVKAVYYEVLRYYTVTYHDALGEVYGVMSFPYGENPNNNYWFTDVKKDADLQYRYYFEGWNVDLTFIDSDVLVYPVFRSELIYYSVMFYSDDIGNQFEYYSLPYNTYLEAPVDKPTKQSTEMYNYIFSGWYLDIEKTIPFTDLFIEQELHVYPKFVEVLRTFRVEFYNNNVLYDSQDIDYGNSASSPTKPTRTSTAKFNYEFSGWSVDFSNITSHLRVDALYEEILRSYTVKFYNGEVLISEQTIAYEASAVIPEEPFKEGNAEYSYSFSGWDKEFNNIVSDLDIYATYTQTPNVYSVSYNTDGGSLIETHNQTYNTIITRPENPTKTGYSFVGWYSDIDLVNSWNFAYNYMPANNLTLYAKWSINTYTVTFYQTEESITPRVVFEVFYVPYGSDIDLDNLSGLPVKSSTEVYVYEFNGWSGNLLNVTENREIYAIYEESLREYDVNFYSEGILVSSQKVHYGDSASKPTDPEKESNQQYSYLFIGWDKSFSNITSNLDIYALFEQIVNKYTVRFYDSDYEIILKEEKIFFGNSANPPANPIKESTIQFHYEFSGWDKSFSNIVSDLNVYPTYAETIRSYTVRFYNENILLSTLSVEYGQAAAEPEFPEKDSTAEYSYSFSGWDKEFNNIVSDLNIYATYEQHPNSYNIYYEANGGSVVEPVSYKYNATVSEPIEPEKAGYAFAGWYIDSGLLSRYVFDLMPASDLTLYAKWDVVDYNIIYLNTYGVSNLNPTSYNITSESILLNNLSDRDSHLFIGFYNDSTGGNLIEEIEKGTTGDITLYARWEIRSYTVSFYDFDDSLIIKTNIEHNSSATAPVEPARAGYTFIGWDKEFNNIISDLNVYAKYEVNSYEVSFNSLGNTIETINVNYDSLIIKPVEPINIGHSFVGWYTIEDIVWDFSNDLMKEENLTLYAKWNINSYTISFDSSGGKEQKKDPLSVIIEKFNERFGTEWSEADKVLMQLESRLLKSDQLLGLGKSPDRKTFDDIYEREAENVIADQYFENAEIFSYLMRNPDAKQYLIAEMKEKVYHAITKR